MKLQAALVSLLAAAGLAQAQTVTNPPNPTTISVSTNTVVRTVDPRFYGVNISMWDSELRIPITDTYLKQVKFGTIRMPGGSLSDDYDWVANKRISDSPNWTWTNSLPDMAKVAEAQAAEAYVTVNYGSGTPEMAAAMVAYLNGTVGNGQTIGKDAKGRDWETVSYWAALRGASPLSTDDGKNFLRIAHPQPFGFTYFEVGNENYGPWEYDQHGVNNTFLTGAKNDPYTYAQYFRDFKAQMVAVDPSIKVGAVVEAAENLYGINTHPVQNPRTLNNFTGWTPVLLANLKTLGVYPDFLIYHYYAQNPPNESDNGLMQKNVELGGKAAAIRQMVTDYIGTATGNGIELVVTELNSVSSAPGKQSANLVNGLFYADSYGTLAQSEFNAVMWWQLHNGPEDPSKVNMSSSLYGWRPFGTYNMITGVSNATDYPGVPSRTPLPTFYAAKLLTHWAQGGDQILKTTSNYTWLSAYAARQGSGKVALLVVNKNPTASVTASIDLQGLSGSSTATIYSYDKTTDAAAAANPDLKVETQSVTTPGFSYTFPSYSMTVILLDSAPAAPSITAQPVSVTTIAGSSATFSVTALGASPVTYQWYKDGVALVGKTAATLDLTNVGAADAGVYTVKVSNSLGTVTSAGATLVLDTPKKGRLINLSVRSNALTGDQTLIAGFIVAGSSPKPLMIRGSGATLKNFGVAGYLPDPKLELFEGQAVVQSNDSWAASPNVAAIITAKGNTLGEYTLDNKDAVLLSSLTPRDYTAKITGAGGQTGVALVEVFDADTALPGTPEFDAQPRLVNVSARTQVGTGDKVLIAGFIINGNVPKRVMIRGTGPTLKNFGVTDTLADPLLQLFDAGGAVIAKNDSWSASANVTEITAANGQKLGSFTLDDKDAVLVVTLSPGLYTAQVSGVNNGTGVALIEVNDLD